MKQIHQIAGIISFLTFAIFFFACSKNDDIEEALKQKKIYIDRFTGDYKIINLYKTQNPAIRYEPGKNGSSFEKIYYIKYDTITTLSATISYSPPIDSFQIQFSGEP